MTQLIRFREFIVELVFKGSGDETIFCFHGFGRDAADFQIFHPLLRDDQRMIVIHLFTHGQSSFPEKRVKHEPLSFHEWKDIFSEICDKLGVRSFHLLAYSMGARVAMVTACQFPEQTKSLLVLAPDGLKRNLIYRFASETIAGQFLYRKIMEDPSSLFKISSLLNKCGIMNDKLVRFLHYHLESPEKRKHVHHAWLIYKKLFPDLNMLAELINNDAFYFAMIFGRYDEVIRVKLGLRFQKKLRRNHLFVLETGHRLLDSGTVNFIRANRLWPGSRLR